MGSSSFPFYFRKNFMMTFSSLCKININRSPTLLLVEWKMGLFSVAFKEWWLRGFKVFPNCFKLGFTLKLHCELTLPPALKCLDIWLSSKNIITIINNRINGKSVELVFPVKFDYLNKINQFNKYFRSIFLTILEKFDIYILLDF